MQRLAHIIQTVLQQSRVLSPREVSMFVEYAQAQPPDIQEIIAQALQGEAENFIRDMDSEVGKLQRAARTRNFPLFQKALSRIVKKVVHAGEQVDNEMQIEDTRENIQDIYAKRTKKG